MELICLTQGVVNPMDQQLLTMIFQVVRLLEKIYYRYLVVITPARLGRSILGKKILLTHHHQAM